MKKLRSIIVALLIAIVLCNIIPMQGVIAEEETPIPLPDVRADSAIVFCENTSEVLYEKNMHTRTWPMSTTKLLTAITATQHLNLHQEITITAESAYEVGSSMGILVGEVFTTEELLYGMLLESGNDAANALAIAAAGSLSAFAALMNDMAAQIGMTNSHFVNPSGLDHSNQYSTVYDLMLLGEVAFDNYIIRQIIETKSYTLPATNLRDSRTLTVSSTMSYDGYFGGKSGSYSDSKVGYVGGYEKDGLRLIAVVLDTTSSQRMTDIAKLFDYGVASMVKTTIHEPGYITGKAKVEMGAVTRTTGVVNETITAYLPKEASLNLVSLNPIYDEITAPISEGDKIGSLELYLHDELIHTYDIQSTDDVEVGWFTARLGISNLTAVILTAIILLIVAVLMRRNAIRQRKEKIMEERRKERLQQIAKKQLEIEEDRKRRGWTY